MGAEMSSGMDILNLNQERQHYALDYDARCVFSLMAGWYWSLHGLVQLPILQVAKYAQRKNLALSFGTADRTYCTSIVIGYKYSNIRSVQAVAHIAQW